MYYHTRQLQYVVYDKVCPAPRETIDKEFLTAYDWLGKYCGYSPQIWLSRSKHVLTGYKRSSVKGEDNWILFGFECIKGFPVHYGRWEFILGILMWNQNLKNYIDLTIKDYKEYEMDLVKDNMSYLLDFNKLGQDAWLKKYLFVEEDQVVVPSLNLKAAKEIICKNEKQKKKLRQMGFIEDRIKIKNIKYPYSY